MRVKIILLLPILLLSSCIKTVNLQDRAIVQAIGIDIKDGEYLVTMQVFSPDGSGGQTIVDPTKQNAKIITTSGKTVSEAMENTSVSQGKVFFLGHNRLIILGESTKSYPLYEILDFFTTSSESRADVKVMMAKREASEILSADINQGILPAQSIEKTVENAYDNSKIANTYLLDILKNDEVLIPLIKAFDKKDEKELKTIELMGSAFYKNGEYEDTLNLDETRGVLLLKGWGKTAVFSTKNFGIRVYESKKTVKNGKIYLQLKAEVLENNLNEKALETAVSDIVKEITLQCENAISKASFEEDEVSVNLEVTRFKIRS